MLNYWDRTCSYLSDKFNISKTKVSIILVLAIIKIVVIVVIFVVFLCRSSESSETSEPFSPNGSNDELILAQAICRHGARNPTHLFPNDPCASVKEDWPEGLGELTNVGKLEHYSLGQYFRKRYAKLIGNGDFVASNIYVRSTVVENTKFDFNRCLMSAATCMAGMFPPKGNQIWNENIQWQPIPIHTVPMQQDILFFAWLDCDRFKTAWNNYTNTTEYKSIFEKYKSLINYLEEKSGDKMKTLRSLHAFYDRLWIGRSKEKCTPPWVENILQKNGDFEQIVKLFFETQTATEEMKRLKSGFLLKEILDQSRKIQGFQSTEPPKLRLYFAHDMTLVDMLKSLGLYTSHLVPYSSCLFFELYKNETDYYFQVFYRNSTVINVPALEIPNAKCGAKCSLQQWYDSYKNILPTKSPEKECAT